MFRKELLILSFLAALVFVTVAGVASLVIRAVQDDGKMLAEDTLPALVNAGEAIRRMDENWFNCHLLLSLDAAEARLNLVHKITDNSTNPFWRLYGEAVHGSEDEQLFARMEADRKEFLEVRADYFQRIKVGNGAGAADVFESRLSPAFNKYRGSAVKIFLFNAKLGQQRADRIIHLSVWTPYALAGFCVMVLIIGVFVGFKASLGAFASTPASIEFPARNQ